MTGLPGLRGGEHLGLTVPDLDAAERFLVDVLGAQVVFDGGTIADEDTMVRSWARLGLSTRTSSSAWARPQPRGLRVSARGPGRHRQPPGRGHHLALCGRERAAVEHLAPRCSGRPRIHSRRPRGGLHWVYFKAPWGCRWSWSPTQRQGLRGGASVSSGTRVSREMRTSHERDTPGPPRPRATPQRGAPPTLRPRRKPCSPSGAPAARARNTSWPASAHAGRGPAGVARAAGVRGAPLQGRGRPLRLASFKPWAAPTQSSALQDSLAPRASRPPRGPDRGPAPRPGGAGHRLLRHRWQPRPLGRLGRAGCSAAGCRIYIHENVSDDREAAYRRLWRDHGPAARRLRRQPSAPARGRRGERLVPRWPPPTAGGGSDGCRTSSCRATR
jgi:catechol 2,3-dioxygenase-like lactoylglutathione lyase family enzyme